MNPISAAFAVNPLDGTAACSYVGPSYEEARTTLAGAIAGGSQIGWLVRNVMPSETMRGENPGIPQNGKEYMPPLIYDLESAIGLSKLPDGRTVNVGDEQRSEEMVPAVFEKDESGRQLEAAAAGMTTEHEEKAHKFSRNAIEERNKLATEQLQAIEDQYAQTAGLKPRKVDTDYAESEHVKKQREDEAQRSETAANAAQAQIDDARYKYAEEQKRREEQAKPQQE